jgi:hypothetical protein
MDVLAHCAELRQHLEAGRAWLDPMTWQLVDELEAEAMKARPSADRGAVSLLDEFDRYASQDPDYDGSPFEARVRTFLSTLGGQ